MDIQISKSSWIDWVKEFKRKPLTETLEITYNFFLEGNSVENIAKKREYKIETIERQVIELITKSLISVDDAINKDKKEKILNVVNNDNVSSLSKLKDLLGEDYSYYEIKCVLASFGAEPERININSLKDK